VAGFAVAGMHVDLLVTGVPPGATQDTGVGSVTRTLLQNIEVLSAGQNYQKDAEGKPVAVQVVNLLVTPDQAETLTLATMQTIQLVLRNPADKTIVSTPGASTSNLFGGGTIRAPRVEAADEHRSFAPAPPPVRLAPPPEKPRTVTMEVFEGSKKVESTFRDPDAVSVSGRSEARP
jgi:pilus assembly protein CpaB